MSKHIMSTLIPLLLVAATGAAAQEAASHRVVPLNKIPSEQWVEVLSGDPSKPGAPYALRIHNDANYVVPPHTHPEDEHIIVVQGSWALGMGTRFDKAKLDPMELGAYGLVPKQMAHFAWSKTETIIHVHGIGPFTISPIEPLYELTAQGVVLSRLVIQPGNPPQIGPPGCFTLTLGARVRGQEGEGTIVGGQCSPAVSFTQYWVQRADGQRFWATREELVMQ